MHDSQLNDAIARTAGDDALDILFRDARTHHAWKPIPISEELLRQVYDLAKLGPTSANSGPLRITFLKSTEAKERLIPAMSPGNVEKTRTAPVVALFAYDVKFYEKLPQLFPLRDIRPMFANNPAVAERTGLVNGTLQAAYFMLAARALGLDCGPMAGFDTDAVNKEFYPDGNQRIIFVCNLGYGSGEGQMPRLPRLDFDEACTIL